jgi:hypothetical protein
MGSVAKLTLAVVRRVGAALLAAHIICRWLRSLTAKATLRRLSRCGADRAGRDSIHTTDTARFYSSRVVRSRGACLDSVCVGEGLFRFVGLACCWPGAA